MKRTIFSVGIAVLLLGTAWMIWKTVGRVRNKEQQMTKAIAMPRFSFSAMNGKPYTEKDLPPGRRRVIINLFHPDCEHCQYMTSQFLSHYSDLRDITLLMVSFCDDPQLRAFYTQYKLQDYPNIVVLRDQTLSFGQIFGLSAVPGFLVYQDKTLLNKISGEIDFKKLIDNDRKNR
jgi:hypothetical protein